MTPADDAVKVGQLLKGGRHLLDEWPQRGPPLEAEEEAFRQRLLRQREHLWGCLAEPAAEPTNNRAERDLRPAVIDRKLSCGNKTPHGKAAWEILRSVVTTAEKQGQNIIAALTPHLRLAPHASPQR